MTGRNIYALLVGIDAYPAPTPRLHGCANDVRAVEALLRARSGVGEDTLHLVTLLDQDATRQGVIEAFKNHLGRAGSGDVVLFYYSGHGSQQTSPEEWWHLEPDKLDETLVLVDSRTDGGWDLADKELAFLLDGVAARDPHVLVVLDCCHSGSGTRAPLEDGTAERRAPKDERPRPLESFELRPDEVDRLVQPLDERGVMGDSGWGLPRAKHVLLSGCRANETSKEIEVDGHRRGAMSLALENALSNAGTGGTYRDVHRQVSVNVGSTVRAQHPQLETSSADDLDLGFLDGAVDTVPGSFVLTRGASGWVLDGGSVHGLSGPVGEDVTVLDVRRSGESESVATVSIASVRAGEATVLVTDGELDDTVAYRAVVVSSPLPPLRASVQGDAEGVAALRSAVRARDEDGPRLVALVDSGDPADISVWAAPDGYSLRRASGERAVCPRAVTAEDAVKSLEHIAAWTRVHRLSNASTQLSPDSVTVLVAPTGATGPEPWEVDGQYRFVYGNDGAQPEPCPYAVTVTNASRRALWVSLVDLTDTYGVFADLVTSGAVELGAGQSTEIPLQAVVPDELWTRGVTEVTDLLKLLVSTEEFDPRTLSQADLDVEADLQVREVRAAPRSAFDRMLDRVATRRARPPEPGEGTPDWFTRDIIVTSVRPLRDVPVLPDQEVEVAPGLTVAPHPSFTGTFRATGAEDATRDLGVAPVPAALDEATPFSFATTRDGAGEADALIVRTVGLAVDVTEEHPLVLRTHQRLDDGESVLPFAWDGEFYIPLGFSRSTDTGCEIVLERLSLPVSTERGFGDSVRIMFRKLVGKRIGLSFEYPLLRLATVDPGGEVTFEKDRDAITRAVSGATTVLVYVHGIISDTTGMVRSSRLSGAARPVGASYDVVLTFDYENLNTPIEENARSLVERLAAVGLSADHGKRMDVVAHSMGGLVSRYMIEFLDGPPVHRLVTLGTPNGGSPWPTVQKWATAAVGFAVNALTAVAWPVQLLGTVLGLVEKVDHALDQMEPRSAFLLRLGEGRDPSVPYDVIIGDRHLVDPVRGASLLSRLSPGNVASALVDLAFLNEPNDLAVSVASARQVQAGRDPAAEFHLVPSDHVSFFATDASLEKLAEVLLD